MRTKSLLLAGGVIIVAVIGAIYVSQVFGAPCTCGTTTVYNACSGSDVSPGCPGCTVASAGHFCSALAARRHYYGVAISSIGPGNAAWPSNTPNNYYDASCSRVTPCVGNKTVQNDCGGTTGWCWYTEDQHQECDKCSEGIALELTARSYYCDPCG
jgi:hypothetical protein